jgi:zinc protease
MNMRALQAIMMLLFVISGCASMPDPRVLATQPVEALIPIAPLEDGIYTLPGSGVSHIFLLFPGGTILDSRGKEGAVELLCSAMIAGGTKDANPEEVEGALDDLAIDISITPQREYTLVGMSFLDDVTGEAMQLFLDILKAPRLDASRLETERGILTESIIREEEDAVTVAFDTYRAHYYRGDPRAYKPTPDTVKAISRDDLVNLHRMIFTKRPLIGVIGRLDQHYAGLLKDAFLTTWTAHPLGPSPDPAFGSFKGSAKERQCVFLMAHAAPTMHAVDYAASVVADHIIGSGGFSSRLVKEVRTREGLAYSANSFYQTRPRWGVFGITVITEPSALKQVRNAVDRVFSEIRSGISEEDVTWAKQAVMNRYVILYNTPASIISHTMDAAFYGILQDFDADFLARVGTLTRTDVQNAALKLIEGPWVEVVINPGD